MKQVVLKLSYHNEKSRKKVMKTVSGHSGVVSIALDSKEMKLTVTGDIDPVSLVSKLRKLCEADILSVGTPKAPEKKKEEPPKKEEPAKKKEDQNEYEKLLQAYRDYHSKYPHFTHNYYVRTIEEDPNACVIC